MKNKNSDVNSISFSSSQTIELGICLRVFFFFVLQINILLSKFDFFVLHINILISRFVFECGGLFFKGGDICPLASYIEIISLVSKVLKQFKESNISSPRGSSLVTKLEPQRLEFSLLTWRFLPPGIRVSKT